MRYLLAYRQSNNTSDNNIKTVRGHENLEEHGNLSVNYEYIGEFGHISKVRQYALNRNTHKIAQAVCLFVYLLSDVMYKL